MENGNGGGVGGVNQTISCADVISKLKDDGDFDKLRLKIIRKLKENEELRNSIVSIVKQSVALNRPGAENIKPRQLSDAIHQEVGAKVNEEISDGLWEIIRSPDGIKTEITETVKSVYSKLSRPEQNENGESEIRKEDGSVDGIPESEVKQALGFSQNEEQHKESVHGFSCGVENKDEDGSDEDPDAPPGFG